MYRFLSFYLLGIILAFAIISSAEKRTLPLRTLLVEAGKICSKRLSDAKHDMLGQNEMDDIAENEAHRCYHACVWENAGFFSNNTFDLENMIPTPYEMQDRIRRVFARTIIYTCVGHGFEIQDECEKASAFMTCFNTLAQRKPLKIQKK